MGAFAGAAAGWALGHLFSGVDNSLGRPFQLWTQQIDAQNAPDVRAAAYLGAAKAPNVYPSPDAILRAWRGGLLAPPTAAIALMELGVAPPPGLFRALPHSWRLWYENHGRSTYAQLDTLGRIWDTVAYLGMQRPAATEVAALTILGRLTLEERQRLKHGIDADWPMLEVAAGAKYQTPGAADLTALRRLGRISEEDYRVWMQRAGWTDAAARELGLRVSSLPTPTEALLAWWRGGLSTDRYSGYLRAAGYVNDGDRAAVELAQMQLPGPADLVRFAVREVWDPAVVAQWGYDEEFPEPFKHWMQWWGMDWARGPAGTPAAPGTPVSWPLAYWRAHWQIISPEQAYRAVRLLRPERIGRYQEISPGVTPFTPADLRTVLKVADYPQPMRKWLAAISSLPLDLRTVRQVFMQRLRERPWVIEQMLDRGLVREDAETWADLLTRQRSEQERRVARRLEDRIQTASYTETLAGYREGLVTSEQAIANLVQLGLSRPTALRALSLEAARLNREEVRTLVKAVRRAFAAGSANLAETAARLRSLGLAQAVADRYLRTWARERTVARRTLATAQVTRLVGEGGLSPALAAVRLLNLGWTEGDAALLIAEAQSTLTQRQARQAAQVAARRKASARELIAARRQAVAAARQVETRLRATTPLATLRRWYCLGIRREGWIRERLAAMGYDTTLVDSYLRDWAIACEKEASAEPPAVAGHEKFARRQTSLATVKRWWQTGLVTDQWTVSRLRTMGYSDESIDHYRRDWRASLTRGQPGPAADEPSPHTAPAVAPHGPRPVHQTPTALSNRPRPAGTP